VLTPTQARIEAILKGLRRFKNDHGHLRINHFERLPDKSELPEYYEVIRNPIALDIIKKKHKRKKYLSVDQAMQDLELMFNNAMVFNEEGSEIYQDADELLKQARILADQEKAKPDDNFRDEDGKLPLDYIEHRGELWRVGDWVHIRNPNDLSKPIVAQIYRTWSDTSGQKWINACWYYRPEQTVHRFDKHFYENEVVKTGQYRDHRIEDVEDRCFVMFITRYPRGRPRGFPPDKAIYVCESRYNEETFRFNKIKTWTSCLPDEVRDRDYEMDLFDVPLNMRKVPSPIKHLLQADAKETDDLPKPTWRSPNAPPLIGAVHRRPREPNVSFRICLFLLLVN
jgi:chromatin structure-remodeling complex subunit RSC1/2